MVAGTGRVLLLLAMAAALAAALLYTAPFSKVSGASRPSNLHAAVWWRRLTGVCCFCARAGPRRGRVQIRRVASGSAPSSRALDTMELVNKVFSRPLLFSFRFDLDVAHTCPICFSSSHRSLSSPRSGCDL